MLHEPILVDQFLAFFEQKSLRVFVDGTVGAGGHASAILKAHPEIEHFYAFDRDEEALAISRETLKAYQDKITFVHGNYRDMQTLVTEKEVDGIFLDVGVSSMQLDRPEKGFSIYREGPLDMRMDAGQTLTAERVVNTLSEKDLGKIFQEYGEEPRWRAAAKAIVLARKKKRLKTTADLAEALKHVLTWRKRKGKKIHPLTLVFQALRIYVNDELTALGSALPSAFDFLSSGGCIGVITFHSLEDRIVKQTFRKIAMEEKRGRLLTKKPLVADESERKRNPRSRSAKMRFLEKI